MSVTDALQCANNTAVIRTLRGHTVACGMTNRKQPAITLAQALLAEGTSSSLAPLCVFFRTASGPARNGDGDAAGDRAGVPSAVVRERPVVSRALAFALQRNRL